MTDSCEPFPLVLLLWSQVPQGWARGAIWNLSHVPCPPLFSPLLVASLSPGCPLSWRSPTWILSHLPMSHTLWSSHGSARFLLAPDCTTTWPGVPYCVLCLLSVLLPVYLSSDLQALGGKRLGCIHFYVLHRLAFYSQYFLFKLSFAGWSRWKQWGNLERPKFTVLWS